MHLPTASKLALAIGLALPQVALAQSAFVGTYDLDGRHGRRGTAATLSVEEVHGHLQVTRTGRFTGDAFSSVPAFTWSSSTVSEGQRLNVLYVESPATGLVGGLTGPNQTYANMFYATYRVSGDQITEHVLNLTRRSPHDGWVNIRTSGTRRATATPPSAGRELFSGWTAISGGDQAGVEYSVYSPWPNEHPNFRGEDLYRVEVKVLEEGSGANRQRKLQLEWFPVLAPPGSPARYPYIRGTNGHARNPRVEDLNWASQSTRLDLVPVELDRGSDGYYKYMLQARVNGRLWRLVVKELSGRLIAELDSNQPGGGIWSERHAEIFAGAYDLGELRDAPHAIQYQWVEAADLTPADRAKIQAIVDAYPARALDDPTWISAAEVHIQNPPNGSFMEAAERQRMVDNFAALEQHFNTSTLPDTGYVGADAAGRDYEVVLNDQGAIIALIATLEVGVISSQEEGSFSVLKTIDPSDQSAASFVRLGRGYTE
jgi:hypothetical protein